MFHAGQTGIHNPNTGARRRWVVKALCLGEPLVLVHILGGWVGPRAGRTGFGEDKSLAHTGI